ncbi:MAG TPA: exodeoxyribonuclease VII large subunit [Burkholderiaceae bacterium]|nr:exodeoxyribonuclease VII large subunit [Burkholderiaceae bacterium]
MALDFRPLDSAATRGPLSVSALNRAVAGLLERSFPLVRVRGEVANLTRAASGHWYFALKDDQAQVRCVMFRGRNQLLNWVPRDGDDVEVSAVVSLYEPRGEFQLSIESMQRAGQGRLFEEFLRLKAKLAAEGLFDGDVKRPLPRVPRRIGVVTSMQAAALRDVLTCLARRAPYVSVVVYPVPVQGAGAGQRIAAMLARVSERAEVDAVLLVRGGGSIEDLWAFNEEAVARAIRASTLPVVVGVGHESDITIADFAADLRAPTPTAAAELVAPARDALLAEAAGRLRQLKRCLAHQLQQAAQRLDYAQRSLATPRAPLASLDARVGALYARVHAAVHQSLARRRLALGRQREALLRLRVTTGRGSAGAWIAQLAAHVAGRRHAAAMRLASLDGRLQALDPHAVLKRGYAMALAGDGTVVTDAAGLQVGESLTLRFARGGAGVRVHALLPADPGDDANG